ncbi:hypothetical protein RQP46_003005 [Phenoliferia psychrophenolica]
MIQRRRLFLLALSLVAAVAAAIDDPNPLSLPRATEPPSYQHLLQHRQAQASSASPTAISIPQTAAQGGLSYTKPAITDAVSFYKIAPSNAITFGGTTELVWDPYAYQQTPGAIPFAQASYTLRVFDERGINAGPTAGRFYGANSIVNFALYSPAAYTPLSSGWTCVACSYAPSLSALSHPLVVALPVTVALMLIGGAGVFNR